jgi:hypothetical protein
MKGNKIKVICIKDFGTILKEGDIYYIQSVLRDKKELIHYGQRDEDGNLIPNTETYAEKGTYLRSIIINNKGESFPDSLIYPYGLTNYFKKI